MEIPEGHYGQIKSRSGLALKKRISIGAGVIDRDYRGHIKVLIRNQGNTRFYVWISDWIAQLVLIRIATPDTVQVETLESTERAEAGFGSTGDKAVDVKVLTAEQLNKVDINHELLAT